MVRPACSYPGCPSPVHGLGLCGKHHRRAWEGRPLGDDHYRYERQPARCTVGGCDRAPFCRGWCKRHYQRWWAHGDPCSGGPDRAAKPAE